MEAHISLDWELIQTIAMSLALGAIIGLERQSHGNEDEPESMGIRTFALASLLGTLSTLMLPLSPALVWIAGIGFLLLLVAFFINEVRSLNRLTGITTQISALLVFVLGAMVPYEPLLATGTAVIVALILSIKRYTHKYVGLLSQQEIFDTLKLLLVSVVLLPLLPNEAVDPWGIYNPRELWFLVVLISSISFAGYFAMRFLGAGRGIIATGTVGGLASSTAVTLAMAERIRQSAASRHLLLAAAFAILVANTIMVVRVTVEVAIVNPSLLSPLWISLLAIFVGGAAGAWLIWRQYRSSAVRDEPVSEPTAAAGDEDKVRLENPFRLGMAMKFGFVFLVIIAIVHVARQELGPAGLLAAAFISGLADVDAIALAVARMAQSGEVTESLASRAITMALISNSLVKIALAGLMGSKRLAAYVALGMLPILGAGLVVALLI